MISLAPAPFLCHPQCYLLSAPYTCQQSFALTTAPTSAVPPGGRLEKSTVVEGGSALNGKGKDSKPRTIYSSLQLQALNRRFQQTYLAR